MTASVEGPMTAATINPDEAAHFGRLAADWWNPSGESAMRHRLNPVRLAYVRERFDSHFGASRRDRLPLARRTERDVGCGAGLPADRTGGGEGMHVSVRMDLGGRGSRRIKTIE